jgi:hypothetical protein
MSAAAVPSTAAAALAQLPVKLVGQLLLLLLLLQGRVSNLAPELNLLLASLVRDMHVARQYCTLLHESAVWCPAIFIT